MARLIMLSTIETVFELTFTACPLTACTPARPLRVFSEVRNTRAREGVPVDEAGPDGVLDLELWCGDGVE